MEIKTIDASLLIKMFHQGTSKLVMQKEEIDALNVFPVPDGDTGTNMSLTMTNAIEGLNEKDEMTVADVAKIVSKGSLMGARGNSGVILSQIFRGFSKGCEDCQTIDVKTFAIALSESAKTAYKAVLKPVEGTILTVIRLIGERAIVLSEGDLTFHSFFEEILLAGEKALEDTPNQLPQLKQAGVVDAGGKGLMSILYGFFEAVCGKDTKATNSLLQKNKPAQAYMHTEDINFTYCTEFIVRGEHLENATLKEDIINMGDSMVYVPDDDLIKVHIHTNDPGEVMQKALQYGELIKIKIENMKEQHGTILNTPNHVSINQVRKDVAFVAVAMGSGMVSILKDLGIDYVIEGGQTMNPSTADIQKAIESVNADNVIVLPNNSNIILAANQSADIAQCHVNVIPTKSVVQGITAMLSYNAETKFDDNVAQMKDVINDVQSIQITYAVRDTQIDDVQITKGDYLSILNGDIVDSDTSLTQTALNTLEKALDDMSEMVSIYYGEDVSKEEAHALAKLVEDKYPDLEIEIFCGNQPVYYYLISVE